MAMDKNILLVGLILLICVPIVHGLVILTEPGVTSIDGNNYTTSIEVSGTTTKTLNLGRFGLANLTASWADLASGTSSLEWDNITGKPSTWNCANISGATSDLCTLVDTDTDSYSSNYNASNITNPYWLNISDYHVPTSVPWDNVSSKPSTVNASNITNPYWLNISNYHVPTTMPANNITPGTFSGTYSVIGRLNVNGSFIQTDTVIDVRAFGANGSDEVDDSVAINRAINHTAHIGGGTIFFPSGKYIINTEPLRICNDDYISSDNDIKRAPISLQGVASNMFWAGGQGMNLSSRLYRNVNGSIISINLNDTNIGYDHTCGGLLIQDLMLYTDMDMDVIGINGYWLGQSTLNRLAFNEMAQAIKLNNIGCMQDGECDGEDYSQQNTFSNIVITKKSLNLTQTDAGIAIQGGESNILSRITIEGNYSYGVWLDGTRSSILQGMTVNSVVTAFELDYCTGISISGIQSEENQKRVLNLIASRGIDYSNFYVLNTLYNISVFRFSSASKDIAIHGGEIKLQQDAGNDLHIFDTSTSISMYNVRLVDASSERSIRTSAVANAYGVMAYNISELNGLRLINIKDGTSSKFYIDNSMNLYTVGNITASNITAANFYGNLNYSFIQNAPGGIADTNDTVVVNTLVLSNASQSDDIDLRLLITDYHVPTTMPYANITGGPATATVTTLPFANISGVPPWTTTLPWTNISSTPAWVTTLPYTNITGGPATATVTTLPFANISSVPAWVTTLPFANISSVPAWTTTLPWSNISGTPTSLPYANLTTWPTKCAAGEAVINLSTGTCSAFQAGTESVTTTLPYANITGGPATATVTTLPWVNISSPPAWTTTLPYTNITGGPAAATVSTLPFANISGHPAATTTLPFANISSVPAWTTTLPWNNVTSKPSTWLYANITGGPAAATVTTLPFANITGNGASTEFIFPANATFTTNVTILQCLKFASGGKICSG